MVCNKAKNDLGVVAPRLAELLGVDVKFVNCTRGAELEETVKNAENVHFPRLYGFAKHHLTRIANHHWHYGV